MTTIIAISLRVVPHGVYDYHGNAGFITLGTSRETSAFVCDAIALAWQEECSETFLDINDEFIRHDPVLGK